jgi:hypothetical protein
MSGFKQLDCLSLPRRARRQAIAQDNRKHRNERECRAALRRLAVGVCAPPACRARRSFVAVLFVVRSQSTVELDWLRTEAYLDTLFGQDDDVRQS